MPYFIFGFDEESICADHHGNVNIIGSENKKKHENNLQDSRVSITLVRTGIAAGFTGPTIFVLKGQQCNVLFTDDCLWSKGCALGSTIIMTEKAFMTNKSWAACTEHLMNVYRNSVVVKDNPDWVIIYLFDVFISHERVVQANIYRRDVKVNSIKEESHTSHCNQDFYQLVAKNDKKVAAETMAKQLKLLRFGNKDKALNQWDLVMTVILIVNQTTPEMCRNYFTRVNLHSLMRIKFLDWTEKIKGFLIVGSIFKNFNSQTTAL